MKNTVCEPFLEKLDAQIAQKHLLKHPFYLAWSRGELSIECLREYAKDYYSHVKAFPTYLSAVHSRCDDMVTRRMLLQNLLEEEAGSPNHPELWKDFALRLGVTEEELSQHKISPEMDQLVDTFRSISSREPIAEGIAALYAYESQIPEICISKIDGLKKHYGRKDPKDWAYFTVHIAADQEHAAQERRLLQTHVTSENQGEISASVEKALDALWNFLTGLCHRFDIAMHCA
jgi:pyrroloquinoline-quinone synthase